MIGISLAVLFTGNGIPTVVLAKNSEVGLEKYRTYYKDLIAQGLVTEKQAAACENGCPSPKTMPISRTSMLSLSVSPKSRKSNMRSIVKSRPTARI